MTFLRSAALMLGFLVSSPHALAQPAKSEPSGPSFSCAAASTPVERAICASPALAAADREMAGLFTMARTSAWGRGASNQLAAQRQALRDMRGCARSPQAEISRCIATTYATRNAQLSTAIVMAAPERALKTLRRIDPAFAPVLEAVHLWALEPVDANWRDPQRSAARARIAALLTPLVTDLLTQEDQSFGRSILADPGPDGVAVTSMGDLFRSDRHFAAFLNVLGPYLVETGPNARRTLPCAAIVRHPALLGATTSVFGSTMDNFVFDNDCEHSLPATPALSALDAKLKSGWPDCDGTIRFAAYRSYATTLDDARLGRVAHDPKAEWPSRIGVTQGDVAAAQAELASYYAQYLDATPAKAAAMAKDALAAILSNAQECGG